ncbi:histidine kinase [Myxococcus sp. K38C18041901]|uniref:histidine kinase dimerization/phospho-acceptor domain-containing protein n=1 Tax=Myxococcus guangdongensis TaxID=2906760 RepID=UPI0020A7412B|nr:histidine kinase dimerization/phospho-acceptor domain-containing protein [Myxococcus guangdongensis]MCP3060793.1 histidine kinase [Myxococcus guangdongensis]
MPIPLHVQAGAWSGRSVDPDVAAGVEQALVAVAERALCRGAQAGMELLLRETLRLTGASGAALFDGRVCVARVGTGIPLPMSGGGRLLKVWPERADGEVLGRLSAFGSTLLAARARESAANTRHMRLLAQRRELEREVARWEQRRSHAAHDLRTPLMVIKGYLDMMMKGIAGPVNTTAQRYLDRMMRAAQDQRALIDHRLGRGALTDLRPLLLAAFGPASRHAQRCTVTLVLPERPLLVKGARVEVETWMRAMSRGLASTRATAMELQVEAMEPTSCWRVLVTPRSGEAPPAKALTQMRELTRRLGGTLETPTDAAPRWVAQLPAELGPPGAAGTH